jgi:hypothetical protein
MLDAARAVLHPQPYSALRGMSLAARIKVERGT